MYSHKSARRSFGPLERCLEPNQRMYQQRETVSTLTNILRWTLQDFTIPGGLPCRNPKDFVTIACENRGAKVLPMPVIEVKED